MKKERKTYRESRMKCKKCNVQMSETKPMHFVCPICHNTVDYEFDNKGKIGVKK